MRIRVHPSYPYIRKIVSSLEEKTGKDIDAWAALMNAEGFEVAKDATKWLRETHKLGLNTATAISSAVIDGVSDQDYFDSVPDHIDHQYPEKKAHLKPLMETLVEQAESIAEDIAVSPCRTYIPVYRNHVIAHIKPTTIKRIDLLLALGKYEGEGDDILIDRGTKAKGDRITHCIEITGEDDINEITEKWLKIAYDLDG